MTIGDVLIAVAGLAAICSSAWALIVTMGLLFPAKAEHARAALLANPRRSIGTGALLVLIPGFLAVVMLGNPNVIVKLAGSGVLLLLLGCGAVGGAGLSFVAGDRLQDLAPGLSPYSVFIRSAGFVIGACVFPFLGWFALAPVAFLASVGCGWKAVMAHVTLFRPRRADQPS